MGFLLGRARQPAHWHVEVRADRPTTLLQTVFTHVQAVETARGVTVGGTVGIVIPCQGCTAETTA